MKHLYPKLGLALVFCTPVVFADHPTIAFGIEGTGAINTISANPLPAGSWGFGIRTEVINNDEFSTEQLENFAAAGKEGVHSVNQITNTSIAVSYGATENLSVSARLPYIERENIREGELEMGMPEAHTHGDSSGVGDLLVLGQFRTQKTADLDAALLFGIKATTGETHEKDDEGERFETEFQPGSGSWDYLLGGSVSKSSGKWGYHANVLYNKTTEGSQSTEIGDALTYNVALSYRLGHDHSEHSHSGENHESARDLFWDMSLELNGETRRKNKISGESEYNSGGTTVFLTPGLRVTSNNLSGFISIGVPVVENQHGTQTDVDSRVVAGLSIGF